MHAKPSPDQDHFTTLPITPLPNTGHPSPSQLHIIIHQPDLLARLERRQADVRASITAERIAQRAVAARAHFALHRKVHFRQVLGLQFGQVGVCLRALGGVFGVEALRETAAAVLAGTAALGVGEACFGCVDVVVSLAQNEKRGVKREGANIRMFNGFILSSSVSRESGSIFSARASSALLGISKSSSSS